MIPVAPLEAPLADAPPWLEQRYLEAAPAARRLAFLLTADHALAEDAVQDAFVRVAARLRQLRDPCAFESYLQRTVMNLVRSEFRHRAVVRRHLAREVPLTVHIETNPDLESQDALWCALQQLAPRQREVITCRYYLELTERETAELLGCRLGTVKSAAARGLAALRAAMTTSEQE